jgi:hypothetical protein
MLISWLILAVLFASCQSVSPQFSAAPTHPDSLLFFGNSLTHYNFGIAMNLQSLAASGDPPLQFEVQELTSGNVRLKDLWESTRITAIQEGNWDLVILQENHHWATREEFFESVRKFDNEIKAAGGETILLMTWERNTLKKFLTTEEIAQYHREIAAELDIKVAPVGLAWQRSMAERPELDLYDPDREHPSARGTYLAVCVLYATIFEVSPEDLPYQPAEHISDVEALKYKYEKWLMTEDEVAFLQRIAWETVTDYYPDPK